MSGLADFGRSGLELAFGIMKNEFGPKNNPDSCFQMSNLILGSPVQALNTICLTPHLCDADMSNVENVRV